MAHFVANADPNGWLAAELTADQLAQVRVDRFWRGGWRWGVTYPDAWYRTFLDRRGEIEAEVPCTIRAHGEGDLPRQDIGVDSVILTQGLDLDTSDQVAVDAWIDLVRADVQVHG